MLYFWTILISDKTMYNIVRFLFWLSLNFIHCHNTSTTSLNERKAFEEYWPSKEDHCKFMDKSLTNNTDKTPIKNKLFVVNLWIKFKSRYQKYFEFRNNNLFSFVLITFNAHYNNSIHKHTHTLDWKFYSIFSSVFIYLLLWGGCRYD